MSQELVKRGHKLGARRGLATALRALVCTLSRIYLAAAIAAVGAMTLISFAQVVLRYVFNAGWVWSQPVALILFEAGSFLGAAVAFHRGRDVVVEVAFKALPDWLRPRVAMLADLLGLATVILLLGQVPRLVEMQSQPMQIVPLPRYVLSYPMVAALLLMALTLLDGVVTRFQGGKGP